MYAGGLRMALGGPYVPNSLPLPLYFLYGLWLVSEVILSARHFLPTPNIKIPLMLELTKAL